MKKLQNNFTTPEQSKRLLELGVPADSADCYLFKFRCEDVYTQWHIALFENKETYSWKINLLSGTLYDYLPCWSVGRLIEIFKKLCPFGDIIGELIMMDENIVESFVHEFENPNVKWNFSKLNE